MRHAAKIGAMLAAAAAFAGPGFRGVEIGQHFRGNHGTGWAPTHARPSRNGAAASRRAALKARGVRLHRQRIGMKP